MNNILKNSIILIPARLGSTRLPNKPLANICGTSMIIRVCNQAAKTNIPNIYVACSEKEVLDEVEKNGFRGIMTDPDLPSGTDRIKTALDSINKDFDYIINLQGDLPNISPEIIKLTLKALTQSENADISTAVSELKKESEILDPSVVKAALTQEVSAENPFANALYFSRSPIPHGSKKFYEHIGIYIYKRESLKKFVSLPVSYLEKTEKLEQLRALSNGMNIVATYIKPELKPISVDTEQDLEEARRIIGSNTNYHY